MITYTSISGSIAESMLTFKSIFNEQFFYQLGLKPTGPIYTTNISKRHKSWFFNVESKNCENKINILNFLFANKKVLPNDFFMQIVFEQLQHAYDSSFITKKRIYKTETFHLFCL